MNREILIKNDFEVTQAELLKQVQMLQFAEDEDYSDDIGRVCEMLEEAKRLAMPKAVIEVLSIVANDQEKVTVVAGNIAGNIAENITENIAGTTGCVDDEVANTPVNTVDFESAFVCEKVSKVNRVVAYVTTCGCELEEWSKGFDDPLEQFWADGIKLIYLMKISKYTSQHVKQKYFPASDMSSLNPGSLIEWPLPQQKALFDAIGGVREAVGVELTHSFLMLPSKSTSGLYFSSDSHYENCALCPIEDCPNRRAKMTVEPRR